MAEAKAKMRTSEDVFKRLRWDDDLVVVSDDAWFGYEDRCVGSMEVQLAAFVPMSEGGDLPFHRIWYLRQGEMVLWDRRRRLDHVFGSGDTQAILASRRGAWAKGFNAKEDAEAARATAEAMARAQVNLAAAEEKRQQALDQKRSVRERRAKRAMAQPAEAPALEEVRVVGGAAADASLQPSPRLRIVTWNVLNDAFVVDPELPMRVRAPRLLRALREADADVIALQECEPELLRALEGMELGRLWRTDGPGELCVLSRYPISRAVSLALGPHKRALLVEVALSRRAVVVANVHLTSDRKDDVLVDNSAKRCEQVRRVRVAVAQAMGHADAFLCGDFNEPDGLGNEAAVALLGGLADAWTSVHGEDAPGATFDTQRNRLAALNAGPRSHARRIDRVFAPPCWRAEAASLLGERDASSDHFGLAATFALQSARLAQPVHTSSLALLPPAEAWPQIDAVRARFDPSYGRWMPHVNLLYGFVPEEFFDEAAALVEAAARRHDAFELCFAELSIFEHQCSASLVCVPECRPEGAAHALQADLEALFQGCSEQSARGCFVPHLTLGKFDCVAEAQRCLGELRLTWRPLTFAASELALLCRCGSDPFRADSRVPLGPALGERDLELLAAVEARSLGARAFALGSAALLGERRPRDSDLDLLLVGPAPREAVFEALSAAMPAAWTRRAEGKFPLLQMEVDSTHLDIQYARSASRAHPVAWPSATCDEGGLAAGALRDLHVLRSLVLRRRGLAGWCLFQEALLHVKRWTRLRGVGSNALGFPGGWSWSLLLAATMLADDHDRHSDAGALVVAMWRRFAAWPWPQVVALTPNGGVAEPEEEAGSALMPILCPAGGTNSARNVTASTLAVLRAELRRAAEGAGAAEVPVHNEFLDTFETSVRCEVRAEGAAAAAVCAGWLEARLLLVVKSLDHVQARPLRLAPGLWAVGVVGERHLLLDATRRLRKVIEQGEWCGQIDVEVEDSEALRAALRQRHTDAAQELGSEAAAEEESTEEGS